MKSLYFVAIVLLNSMVLNAQNTVGTILNTENALNGYTLFAPFTTETYLINNCGEIVNQWSSSYVPGASVYLLENGDLLRTCKIANSDINFGGVGGRIERYDWDNNLVWSYDYTSSLLTQHHDIFPLPNGNILVLAVTTISEADAIQMGRDPSKITEGKIYNEEITEIEPIGSSGGNIVWRWNISDHLIQDFDTTKDNYGVVSDNPQLLDINFLGFGTGAASWLHINSMQYNEELNQILLSPRLLSEIYIIDHSTTTAEAATNSGGTYGKGGDLLYRWGNPMAYKQGIESDQKLFGQHNPTWIPNGLVDGGKIVLFNNGFSRSPSYSEVFILTPPTDTPGFYQYTSDTAYGPLDPDYTYIDPIDQTNFYSPIVSNAQRLSNNNLLICEGTSGHFFEIDEDENIVWEYISPAYAGGIMSQGDDPSTNNNTIFRVQKFAADFSGFIGKDLTPGAEIEQDPEPENCTILYVDEISSNQISIYPNPVQTILNIDATLEIKDIEIFDLTGKSIDINTKNKNKLDISTLASGIYSIKFIMKDGILVKKIIKK